MYEPSHEFKAGRDLKGHQVLSNLSLLSLNLERQTRRGGKQKPVLVLVKIKIEKKLKKWIKTVNIE